ncbi:transcription antitermination factor NusB [Acidaminobacterium chupaoyuni]
MSRREARELALHMIYAGEYSEKMPADLVKETLTPEYFATMAEEYDLYRAVPPDEQMEYLHRAVEGVLSHGPELDSYLEKYAVGWSVSRISRISKCIMRLSMYEMLYLQIPVAASVNEAVELAKKYESNEAASFINGLLATFVKKELSL